MRSCVPSSDSCRPARHSGCRTLHGADPYTAASEAPGTPFRRSRINCSTTFVSSNLRSLFPQRHGERRLSLRTDPESGQGLAAFTVRQRPSTDSGTLRHPDRRGALIVSAPTAPSRRVLRIMLYRKSIRNPESEQPRYDPALVRGR